MIADRVSFPTPGTSLQITMAAYVGVLDYKYGMSRPEMAEHMASGWLEFWGDPTLAFLTLLALLLVVLVSNARMASGVIGL